MARPARPSDPRLRRTPGLTVNWTAFVGTGVVLGFLIGVLLQLFGPDAPAYGMRTSALFFGAFGAMLGALITGLVGVVVDAVLTRR